MRVASNGEPRHEPISKKTTAVVSSNRFLFSLTFERRSELAVHALERPGGAFDVALVDEDAYAGRSAFLGGRRVEDEERAIKLCSGLNT